MEATDGRAMRHKGTHQAERQGVYGEQANNDIMEQSVVRLERKTRTDCM